MAFVLSSPNSGKVKVDIIFIPAIGADPQVTFARTPGEDGTETLDLALREKLHPAAHVHLYDHLTEDERRLEAPRRLSIVRPTPEESALDKVYHDKEGEVSEWGVKQWGERLLKCLLGLRETRHAGDRPIIFICHSTGGNVLKQALTERSGKNANEIASHTLAITFFAVPHHGSSVLSRDQYVREVQAHLGLKWRMSRRLRQDFRLRDQNEDLQLLNHRFAVDMIGIKIHSYAETADTHMKLLLSTRVGGEQETELRECIVDSRSGKLGTAQVPVEDEEFCQLDLTHVEMPRFPNQHDQYDFYLDAIEKLVEAHNDANRSVHRKLIASIMNDVQIHVHRFYGEENHMKILLAKPSLAVFLRDGPDKAMADRLEGDVKVVPQTFEAERPKINLHEPSEPKNVPTFKVEAVESDRSSNEDAPPDRLAPLVTPIPKNIHTHRPPPPEGQQELPIRRNLEPGLSQHPESKSVRFAPEVPKSASLQLPDSGTGFRWIHVPFTHPGWVHQILGTISEEKANLQLHNQLLRDKMWFSQHNQARHAFPHARFVRPSAKFLFPEGGQTPEVNHMIPSACDDIQQVVYMPYLHWDSFINMQKRAAIIAKRLQPDARGLVPSEVANGKSTEHKLIWQCLSLDRPLHCRRTLDQYGYPALRNTKVRDHDQILWKRTKADLRDGKASHPKHGKLTGRAKSQAASSLSSDSHIPKVLMVDQLWLWVVDHETVVTFFPGRENDNNDGYTRDGDVRSLIYQDINGDYANPTNDPYDFAGLAIRHVIRALLAKTTDETLQVFHIFEEYISIQTEKQNLSWKKFRKQQDIKLKDIDSEEHVNHKEDLDALLELRDIEDELNTIDKLLKEQSTIVKDMLLTYQTRLNPQGKGLKGTDFLQDTSYFLQEHQAQVSAMRESTSAAQNAYKDLLDMKQKQANVLEARLAGQQSQTVARQSRAILIFTIFTIIFLPLSFLASVFGINSAEWSDEGTHYLPLRQIVIYMVTISFGCVVIALLAAFSRSVRRRARQAWQQLGKAVIQRFRPSSSSSTHPKKTDTTSTWGSGLSGISAGWMRNRDLEKEAADVQVQTEKARLSALSRTQSLLHAGEKFERDMQTRGGSFTGKGVSWMDSEEHDWRYLDGGGGGGRGHGWLGGRMSDASDVFALMRNREREQERKAEKEEEPKGPMNGHAR